MLDRNRTLADFDLSASPTVQTGVALGLLAGTPQDYFPELPYGLAPEAW